MINLQHHILHDADASSVGGRSYRSSSSSSGVASDDSAISFTNSKKSSSKDGGSTSNSTGGDGRVPGFQESLARKENKLVRVLRSIIFLVLACIAGLASAGIYRYSKYNEEEAFRNEFAGQGQKLISGFQGDSFTKLQAMESLSHSVTAYALESESTWPFVTIPDSSRHFESYLSLTGAASLQFMPIVDARERRAWEKYSFNNQDWIDTDLVVLEEVRRRNGGGGNNHDEQRHLQQEEWIVNDSLFPQDDPQEEAGDDDEEETIPGTPFRLPASALTEDFVVPENSISRYIKNYVGIDTSPGPWLVWWQYTPAIPNRWPVNFNRLSSEGFSAELRTVRRQTATLSSTLTYKPGLDFQSTRDFEFTNQLFEAGDVGVYESGEPLGYIHYPVFDTYNVTDRETVAILTATVYWKSYFQDILSDTVTGIVCVIENSLGQAFTYEVNGKEATFLGMDDLHDEAFTEFGIKANFESFASDEGGDNDSGAGRGYTGVPIDDEYVSYRINVYPSSEFQAAFVTNQPRLYAMAVLSVFLLTVLIFVLYDLLVERRQHIVMTTAVKSNAVVSSLFPEQVRERLMDQAMEQQNRPSNKATGSLTTFLNNVPQGEDRTSTKPIADLFTDCTVLFADIAGFTAWASVREPTQVFVLLETLYDCFDKIAKSRRVFKVETIGDCYMAVTGLPDPRKDHAVVMARFASDCLERAHVLTRELEVDLGPGTGDLTIRVGMHSGPVTAGVLRGEKSRFQLFGDTVNTASRMESTSKKGRIQVSDDTARLLQSVGKGQWLIKRGETVQAKGKGDMSTYWLQVKKSAASTVMTSTSGGDFSQAGELKKFFTMNNQDTNEPIMTETASRLIEWNVEILRRLLKQIISFRAARLAKNRLIRSSSAVSKSAPRKPVTITATGGTVLDEVVEIIELPAFDAQTAKSLQERDDSTQLSDAVSEQLQNLVMKIFTMYRRNPFHNFEHASHVTMSVSKLLSRIVAPSDIEVKDISTMDDRASILHDHTYGITSDPLTHFACVFAALIHDVDHTGVPNTCLVKENSPLAKKYNNRSVAEQNSLDLAWEVLMSKDFTELRAAICCDKVELGRFRQLVVNSVMATDIMDKDLKKKRNEHWDKAFAAQDNTRANVNRKATIVIEHLIQASDVAHTMQHWHVFRKWNEDLFNEMCDIYDAGRSDQNPADNWYKGEIGFFDFYVIPLAKKLKTCGVFGVSSDEYLKYAENNRREWEEKGEKIVAEMVQNRTRNKNRQPQEQPRLSGLWNSTKSLGKE